MRFTLSRGVNAVEQLRRELTLLKSGVRHIYADGQNTPIEDITYAHIVSLERALANYKRALFSYLILPRRRA